MAPSRDHHLILKTIEEISNIDNHLSISIGVLRLSNDYVVAKYWVRYSYTFKRFIHVFLKSELS